MLLFTEYIIGMEYHQFSRELPMTFNDIHYKYNFIVQLFYFNDTISVKKSWTKLFLLYPEKIVFSSDSTIIRLIMNEPSLDTKSN